MYDVITIGAATKDVFLVSDQFQILSSSKFETGVGECVALGSKIEISDLLQTTGGGATNAAVTFARLGFRAAVVCKIGKDSAGKDVLAELKKDRVSTALVATDPKEATAYSTLLTTKTGERTVLVYRGASGTIRAADIPLAKCKAKWFYVTSIGGNLALFSRILAHSSKTGASVAWNPGGKEIDAGLKKLLPMIRRVRVLSLNKEEAARLTQTDDVPSMLAALGTPGNVVIVTDGKNGAYVHRDPSTHSIPQGRPEDARRATGSGQAAITFFAPGTGKAATSQTGAGDAFGSGFMAALMKTDDLRTALAVATLNAESVIQHVGAKAGILKAWPTEARIKSIKIS